ncbi:MAG: hypothetical protein K2I89_08750 [Muribaculaceae bacterium]|nr:hypothetical protein [Muribaculaceae bacterium]MDE5595644.1 hypothetical protein [Muribaculaceae bacterium]
MNKNKQKIFIQVMALVVFCVMALASASSKQASSDSNIDWRGAAVGGVAGYNGYIRIGTASSESEARQIAGSKGYSEYLWDSVNGAVYAK